MDLSTTFLSMFTKFRSYGRYLELAKNPAQISGRIGENFCANWFYRSDRENGPRKVKILVQVASCWISNWVTAPRLQHGWFGVKMKLGQKLQGEKFEISQIHS